MEQRYYTIKQAAAVLGVSALTLRNWDKNGKLIAYRHPMNNYRVYKKDDLDELMKNIETSPRKSRKLRVSLEEE
ncbi:MAG: MerR family DNA-binding transcriptional regulator [Patescibacteria group bacterium]